MVDLVQSVFNLYDLFLYVCLALSVLGLLYAIILKAKGDPKSFWYFISSFVALVLIASANSVLAILYSGNDVMYLALIGLAFVSAVYYFAIGQFRKGVWHLIGACAVAVAITMVPVVCQWFGVSPSNVLGVYSTIPVSVSVNPVPSDPGDEVTIKVYIRGTANSSYTVTVNFGDSSSSSQTVTTDFTGYGVGTFRHIYTTEGNYSVVATVNGSNGWGIGMGFAVVKRKPWWGGIFSAVNVFLQDVGTRIKIVTDFPLTFLLTNPIVDITNANTVEGKFYNTITTISVAGFALFLAFRIVHAVLTSERVDWAIVNSIKEGALAIILIAIGPWIYNVTAQLTNAVSYNMLAHIHTEWMLSEFFGILVLTLMGGAVLPGLGTLSTVFILVPLFCAIAGYIRYYAIMTFVVCIPLLSISYLHPGLRGIVRNIVGIWGALMLVGPLSAVLLALITEGILHTGGNPILGAFLYCLLTPILLVLVPKATSAVLGNYFDAATTSLSTFAFPMAEAQKAVGTFVVGGFTSGAGGTATSFSGGVSDGGGSFVFPTNFGSLEVGSGGNTASVKKNSPFLNVLRDKLPPATSKDVGLDTTHPAEHFVKELGLERPVTNVGQRLKSKVARSELSKLEDFYLSGLRESYNLPDAFSIHDLQSYASRLDFWTEGGLYPLEGRVAYPAQELSIRDLATPSVSRFGRLTARIANIADKVAYNVAVLTSETSKPDTLAGSFYLTTGRYIPTYILRKDHEDLLKEFVEHVMKESESENESVPKA